MANPFDTEHVKNLRSIWNQKLAESGFEDIEVSDHPYSPLKTWHSFKWKNTSPERAMAKIQYYVKARELLLSYKFDNPTHKIIWECHSEGLSKRKIEPIIASLKPAYKREQIGKIINFIASSII